MLDVTTLCYFIKIKSTQIKVTHFKNEWLWFADFDFLSKNYNCQDIHQSIFFSTKTKAGATDLLYIIKQMSVTCIHYVNNVRQQHHINVFLFFTQLHNFPALICCSYWGCWIMVGLELWTALALPTLPLLKSLKCSYSAGWEWFKLYIMNIFIIVLATVYFVFTHSEELSW